MLLRIHTQANTTCLLLWVDIHPNTGVVDVGPTVSELHVQHPSDFYVVGQGASNLGQCPFKFHDMRCRGLINLHPSSVCAVVVQYLFECIYLPVNVNQHSAEFYTGSFGPRPIQILQVLLWANVYQTYMLVF